MIQNSETIIYMKYCREINNRIVETFYSEKCSLIIQNEASALEILPRVLSKIQDSSPRFHWRNCYTSYKCISFAHSFHASASPRVLSPFLRVSGDFFSRTLAKSGGGEKFRANSNSDSSNCKCK